MISKSSLFVFDLDGVITNPENSSVNSEVLNKIHSLLVADIPVAINTGRSYDWVKSNLITYLERKNNSELFNNLVIVCEKGGEIIQWNHNRFEISPSLNVLKKSDYKIAKEIFESNKHELNTMFWDNTKRTMASIEKSPKASLNDFHTQQKNLVRLLSSSLISKDIRIDATTIATDVESRTAGKYAGAKHIVDWIKSNYMEMNKCVCLGDSISDYDMALCFADHGIATTYVYVGVTHDMIPVDSRIDVDYPKNNFDLGSLEYLSYLLGPRRTSLI